MSTQESTPETTQETTQETTPETKQETTPETTQETKPESTSEVKTDGSSELKQVLDALKSLNKPDPKPESTPTSEKVNTILRNLLIKNSGVPQELIGILPKDLDTLSGFLESDEYASVKNLLGKISQPKPDPKPDPKQDPKPDPEGKKPKPDPKPKKFSDFSVRDLGDALKGVDLGGLL